MAAVNFDATQLISTRAPRHRAFNADPLRTTRTEAARAMATGTVEASLRSNPTARDEVSSSTSRLA